MTQPSSPSPTSVPRVARERAESTERASSSQSQPAPRPERGFRALLQDAGLWELVQLRCESRTRSVVRVTSPRGVGYLYFADGQIVHAVTGSAQGERAALHIMGWSEGTWDTCERAWPTQATIDTAWQGLLLRAAQLQDEAKRKSGASAAAAAPAVAATPAPTQTPTPATASANANTTGSASATAEQSGISYRIEEFEHAVRMDARGNVLTGNGAVEEHAALAAYGCRLGDLMGELLGLGPMIAVEGALRPAGRCLIFRDAAGDTVLLRPRAGVDLSRLRAQLAL